MAGKKGSKLIKIFVLLIVLGAVLAYNFRDRLPESMNFCMISVKAAVAKDSDFLTINRLGLDSTYDNVKKVYPQVGQLQGQDKSLSAEISVFTEAFADVDVKVADANVPAKMQFNFSDGKLYSYYFNFDNLDKDKATALFENISGVFTPIYGEAKQQVLTIGDKKSNTNDWTSLTYTVVCTMATEDSNTFTVSAGYQKNKAEVKK
jgi:hypothetical protein